ncbi:uncharacterized protein [Dysidea avara]|uniref:uncharacterized protein n=1 Tax=Dysidea avara TaxID=196820 RepID=UPI003319DCEA
MVRLPHENYADNLSDPDYGGYTQLQCQARTQAHLLRCFQSRWKHEYLTALREHHRTTDQNRQAISVGDVVIVHDDDGPRVNWKLAVVTNLLVGGDRLTRAAEIQTSIGQTNRPITNLYPLEVHSDESDKNTLPTPRKVADEVSPAEQPARQSTETRPMRQSARRATEWMTDWVETLCTPLEDVEM